MRGIILAAGRGRRLGKLTSNKPKCLLELNNGETLFSANVKNFKRNNIKKIGVVVGYKKNKLPTSGLKKFNNSNWKNSNILKSLLCSQSWLKKYTCLISYSDIFYDYKALKILKESKGEINILYHVNWENIWKKRFKNPLSDLETFKFNKKKELTEIGKKTIKKSEIQGQYLGLIKITPKGWQGIAKTINKLSYKELKKMDITSFFSFFIKNENNKINVSKYSGNWFEIDNSKDYKILKKNEKN
tara:strand:- start:6367 stop:7098 length:732 start_codon:yes stop_codon:yes gene_type:complete